MTALRRAVSWTLFVLWAAAVWTVSSRSDPASDLDWAWAVPDKVAHGVEFAIGGFLGRAAFLTIPIRTSPSAAALLACSLWGFADEIHQGFVPSRVTDPWDLAADVTGVAIGVAIHVLIARSARGSR